MNRIKVMIVDDNEAFVDELAAFVMRDPGLLLVGKAYNADQAKRIIRERVPDVVTLDIIMPKGDGLSVMDAIMRDRLLYRKPGFLVVTAVGDERVAQDAFAHGALYYLRKPTEIPLILSKIRTVYNRGRLLSRTRKAALMEEPALYNSGNLDTDITGILHELGIPNSIKGFAYLRDAVKLALSDHQALNVVSRDLYPKIAELYQTSPQTVERAIRYAIDITWTHGDMDAVHRIFGYSVKLRRNKPSNTEFIALLTDKMSMDYKNTLPN
ncbi:MAG: sporulation transcription factor Spo0A [Blautia sp.]|nr:sporulation transcription factor Spo0A [Blautia sp.]